MVENVIQIKKENNDKYWCQCKNIKDIVCVKKIIFGILPHGVLKMVSI